MAVDTELCEELLICPLSMHFSLMFSNSCENIQAAAVLFHTARQLVNLNGEYIIN